MSEESRGDGVPPRAGRGDERRRTVGELRVGSRAASQEGRDDGAGAAVVAVSVRGREVARRGSFVRCGEIGAVPRGDLEGRAAGVIPRVRGNPGGGAPVDDEGGALGVGRRRRGEETRRVERGGADLDELDRRRERSALDREEQGVRGGAIAVGSSIFTHRSKLHERAHLRGAVVEHGAPERTRERRLGGTIRKLDGVGRAR